MKKRATELISPPSQTCVWYTLRIGGKHGGKHGMHWALKLLALPDSRNWNHLICLHVIIDPIPIFKRAIKTPSYVRIYAYTLNLEINKISSTRLNHCMSIMCKKCKQKSPAHFFPLKYTIFTIKVPAVQAGA